MFLYIYKTSDKEKPARQQLLTNSWGLIDWNLITDCPALNFDKINSLIKFDDDPNAEMKYWN